MPENNGVIHLKSLEPRLVSLPEIILAAKCVEMSFVEDKTYELWNGFGPLIETIKNKVGRAKYSVQIYPDANFFIHFNVSNVFNKYAAVEIDTVDNLANGLESLIIPSGLYAVFDYIGKPSEAQETFQYIYSQWLPSSDYALDDRPHFAKMGAKYKGEQSDSEEELFVPLRKL